MADPKEILSQLHENLHILKEREAKHGLNVPLELKNQIDDHREAIALTEQAIGKAISEAAWREALKPLLITSATAARPSRRPAVSPSAM